ncbi:elongation factor 1-beta [Methanonatronarchaeum sp. AMET6-2]|uniref:elongation factor 1-beta n=1 Tax=Methanonatronarchaeum sp. AMET6-2 TaxID=2933293 RepID=UPI0011FC19BB|nr:elongation factor 1-beta [Methanonatronarchaeum sp. AMET6-2]RZN61280.1 MAG: elongation factor 1-beta [Methanonatronarchaeia archaeon]UOY09717.1 elongation factor 1-beta [Methanonatronarchaeum sp. AMET6-2]
MGEVAAKIKVMPKNPDVDLDELESAVEEKIDFGSIKKIEREDVAFGLKALLLTVVVPDEEGGTEAIEDSLSDVKDIESVRVEGVNRLM